MRAGRRETQSLEVAQPRALGRELVLLGLARRGRLDLAELPLEQVELAVARARALAQLLELLAQRALARVDRRERRAPHRLLGPAEAVEDLQLRRGERQLAVLVLAVEREQRAADVAQIGGRGAAAADYARVRPSALTRRASTSSSASAGIRSPSPARSVSGSSNTPST